MDADTKLNAQERSDTPSFVGIDECGHIVACAVDTPEFAKENSKFVASWMRSGLRIEKMPCSEARKAKWCELRTEEEKMKRTGLDDGPPLPSEAARERAYKKIEAARYLTDSERINWLDNQRYIRIGLGWSGKTFGPAIQIGNQATRYIGSTLRAAIDAAIKGAGDPE